MYKWGGYPNFRTLTGIVSASDGSVYVADRYNTGINVYDSSGNFLKYYSWGFNPWGISIAQDGSVYVTDWDHNSIYRMIPFVDGANVLLFESNTSVTQPGNLKQDYITNIGALNVTGKLYLEAVLKNSLGQSVAVSEHPFYVVNNNIMLSVNTDKKLYKPGEIITVTGAVTNLATTDVSNLNLQVMKQQPGSSTAQTLYTKTISISSGGTQSFTFQTTEWLASTEYLTAQISQNNVSLAAVTDQYQVAGPQISASFSGPDIVDKNPFDLNLYIAT